MKRIILLSFLVFHLLQLKAQIAISNDISGAPIEAKNSPDEFKGNKYLKDAWTKGDVLQRDNKFFKDMDLKYDLLQDMLIFKNNKEDILAFKYPVKEFHLKNRGTWSTLPSIYRNGYPATEKFTKESYYEVLAEGKASLLKKQFKTFVDAIAYGASETKKTLIDNEFYFLFYRDKMIKIKNPNKDIPKILADKENEIKAFIKNNNINLKSEENQIRVIDYYNSLN